MNLISQAQYAKHRGVSPAAVSYAVKEGRITLINGKVDPVAADAQWDANTRNPKIPSINHSSADPIPDTVIPQSLYDLQLARAKREYHEANIAEMRERQKAGELVELRDVQLAYTTLYAQLRAAMERIPDKLAPRLAAETSADAVHALLVLELDQCLMDMARMAEQIPDRLIEAGGDG
ncbi:MAG TPA: hypothetical protein PK959_06675 [Candidatus Competibacteraceae bacterium]|nr:hypothetical protein [Candidatus Competibacteraceae bacterium]